MTPLESLLLELIPQRISRAPKATAGPTEQWAAAERQRELWRVAGESVSDAETVAGVERMTEAHTMSAPPGLTSELRTQLPGDDFHTSVGRWGT